MNISELLKKWLDNVTDFWKTDLESAKSDAAEIEDRFYKTLDFGTGGIRGKIGSGINRMNIYTVRRVSRGLADYLLKTKPQGAKILISYDTRHYSREFAAASAEIFAEVGINAYLFKQVAPTPLCSFAIRHLGCDAGVMVTASHNPKDYNGYKVYDSEGCQLNLEASDKVIECINNIDDYFSLKTSPLEEYLSSGAVEYVGKEVFEAFIDATLKASYCDDLPKKIKIVYTPLNGTGNVPVRDVLQRKGFENVWVVPEQEYPDGDFKTCPYPNPESKDSLRLAFELAEQKNADIILATDPDSDRVGIAVRHGEEYRLLDGNIVGALLSQYLLFRKSQNTLPKNPTIIKTIVTTDIVEDIVKEYGGSVINVLTGFKFIGEKMNEMERKGCIDQYVLGFEESIGYLVAPHARDKDGVSAALLLAEMSDYYLSQGLTLVDVINEMYKKFGFFGNSTLNIEFKGKTGAEDMKTKLDGLRARVPAEVGGQKVTEYKDYLNGINDLPKSDVLEFVFDKGKVLIRPSGTEPKLKIYAMAKCQSLEERDNYLKNLLNSFAQFFK